MPANWAMNTTVASNAVYLYSSGTGYSYGGISMVPAPPPPKPPGPLERLAAEVDKVCARARA